MNSSADTIARGEVLPEDGGFERAYQGIQIQGLEARSNVDVLIVPVPGAASPRITATATQVDSVKSAASHFEEYPHITSTRPLLSADVSRSLAAPTKATQVRVEGTFAVAVWSWNLTVGTDHITTGAVQTNVQRDPVTGQELTSHTFQQVAQLTFHDGWLDIALPVPIELFVDRLQVKGAGSIKMTGVNGLLANGEPASNANLHTNGTFEVHQAWTNGNAYTRFIHATGQSTLDGKAVDVLTGPPNARPGVIVATPGGDGNILSGLVLGILGLMIVAVVMHGPMQGLRFRGIQRRFDERDYIEVLTRIDPFTRRRRFTRPANLLKAVSLLSLHQYKEASLFLATLGPLDGPDPATQAFLRACAAAGQARDADAIQHLTDCFRLDASYKEEARTIPALRGLLPYFEVDAA